MTRQDVVRLLSHVTYKDWTFIVGETMERLWLQVSFPAKEGEAEKEWHGRKWLLSEHMTGSEVIQTALKAVLTAEEHEAREAFMFSGRAIFGPHISLNALWNAAPNLEERNENRTNQTTT